jgi:hypothetical protein
MRDAFASGCRTRQGDTIRSNEFIELVDAIERALFTFESTSNHALMRLYHRTDISGNSIIFSMGDSAVPSGGDNETVFLVYL